MPSTGDLEALVLAVAILVMPVGVVPVAAAAAAEEPAVQHVTDEEVRRAVREVARDPDLGSQETTRRLRFSDFPEPRESGSSPFVTWLGNAFGWLAGVTRWMFWLIVAALVGLIAVGALRVGRRGPAAPVAKAPGSRRPPTRVRDVDIRPEGLPVDIGSTALTLSNQGEQDAALALLYRGTLSRLAHRHALPIQSSTTEGECAALAQRELPAPQARFVRTLVACRVQGVYGGRRADASVVRELCTGFAPLFEGGSPSALPARISRP